MLSIFLGQPSKVINTSLAILQKPKKKNNDKSQDCLDKAPCDFSLVKCFNC